MKIHDAEILVPGGEYKIVLFRWTGPGAQDGEIIGITTFVR